MVAYDRSLCQVAMGRVRVREMLRRVCRSGHQGVACEAQDKENMVMWVQSLGKGLWTLGLCLSFLHGQVLMWVPPAPEPRALLRVTCGRFCILN